MHTHETKNLIAIPEYMVTVCKMIKDFQRGFVFTHPFKRLLKLFLQEPPSPIPLHFEITIQNKYIKTQYAKVNLLDSANKKAKNNFDERIAGNCAKTLK